MTLIMPEQNNRRRNSGGALQLRAAVRGRNWRTAGRVFVQLVAQGSDRNAQNICRMGAVAETVLERFQDQVALDFGHGAANEIAGDLFGRHDRMGGEIGASRLIEPRTVRGKNPVNADFDAGREQNSTVQGIFQFAHVAWPTVYVKRPSRLG